MKLKHIILISAFAIAGCAAWFSVSGIARLFAGAYLSAIFMAVSLELGKLVSVSFLYRYWARVHTALKTYMSIGVLILMLITSAGIYGYLSSAYAKVASAPQQLMNEMALTTSQIDNNKSIQQRYQSQLQSLFTQKQQQENRLDSLISRSTTGSTNSIRRQQLQLQATTTSIQSTQQQLDSLVRSESQLSNTRITQQSSLNTNSELGTFVYLANILNVSLDTLVKWFVLILVCVFDPLAVALMLAYNRIVQLETGAIPEVNAPVPAKSIMEKVVNKLKTDVPKAAPADAGLIPYYRQPDYKWDEDDRWKKDPEAIYFKEHHQK